MGDGRSIPWIVGLSIYFLVLFTISYTFNASYADVVSGYGDGPNSTSFELGERCGNPRSQEDTFFTRSELSARCRDLNADTEQVCDSIVGCEWVNTSTVLWFFEVSVDAYCDGVINMTEYGAPTDPGPTGIYSDPYNPVYVCEVDNVSRSQSLCSIFACSWYDGDFSMNPFDSFSFSGVWESLKWIAGFSVEIDTDFPGRFIVSLFLFWIPFVALIVSVRYLLPI